MAKLRGGVSMIPMSNKSGFAVRDRLRANRPFNLVAESERSEDPSAESRSLPRVPNKKPEWTGRSGVIQDRNIVAVLIESIEINTKNFMSRDRTSEREGPLPLPLLVR